MNSFRDTNENKNNEIEKNILNFSDNEIYINFSFKMRDIFNLIYDNTFLEMDNNGNNYYIYFDIEKKKIEINSTFFLISELDCYLNNMSKTKNNTNLNYNYINDTQYSYNNHINNCIDNFLCFEIDNYSYISIYTNNYSNSYIYNYICTKIINSDGISIKNTYNDSYFSYLNINGDNDDNSSNFDITKNYSHLWIQCENCYGLNYKKFFKLKINICEQCGYHLKMSSSDRIELLIDQDTWKPIDENMVSMDPIEFNSEEEPYLDHILYNKKKTGLNEAVETGIGQLNGITIAMAVMDFQFMGGSMGSIVGEKITRLIEFATNQSLPIIIICASGGARMQEGSLSLMQMAKISSASYDYQSNKKLFYITILTSPTTGGVTASFGMLGDVIIAEPNAYIAFAGKRVIEETLNTTVPDGSQESEYLFDKGLFDSIVPRNLLKSILSELLKLHGFLL